MKLVIENNRAEFLDVVPAAYIKLLETKGDWDRLTSFVERQMIDDGECRKLLEKCKVKWNEKSLIAVAVRVLARSDRLANDKSKSQQKVSEFLKRHLIVEKNEKDEKRNHVRAVHNHLDLSEAGAAIERAYRLTYALEYYEQWFIENSFHAKFFKPTDDQLTFARTRWLICKKRLSKAQQSGKGGKHDDEAMEMSNQWKIIADDEPQFPELSEFVGTVLFKQESAINGGGSKQDKLAPSVNYTEDFESVKIPFHEMITTFNLVSQGFSIRLPRRRVPLYQGSAVRL